MVSLLTGPGATLDIDCRDKVRVEKHHDTYSGYNHHSVACCYDMHAFMFSVYNCNLYSSFRMEFQAY